MISNASINTLQAALDAVNKRFDGNIRWKRSPERIGKRYQFTLTVIDSKLPGARRSASGRRISAACWHVHGHFFDAVFELEPDAYVSCNGEKVYSHNNWQDRNIGSMIYPLMYSEACECGQD